MIPNRIYGCGKVSNDLIANLRVKFSPIKENGEFDKLERPVRLTIGSPYR